MVRKKYKSSVRRERFSAGRNRSVGPLGAHDLSAVSRRAPALAGDLAYRLFCTPALSERRAPDHDALTARARFHLRHASWIRVKTAAGAVQAYVLEPSGTERGATVLVAHGWTSESSFMTVLAEPIRRAGFRVVLFDQPAHGLSAGRHASLIDCARAMSDVAREFGPVSHVIAHSMGCLAALLVGEGGPPMRRPWAFERYVLIACPNEFSTVTAEFCDGAGLSRPARRVYERHLERIAHRSIASFSASRMLAATGRPALLIHARDDAEVSFSCAGEIASANPQAEVLAFDGLGHRAILYATPVARAALSFLSRP